MVLGLNSTAFSEHAEHRSRAGDLGDVQERSSSVQVLAGAYSYPLLAGITSAGRVSAFVNGSGFVGLVAGDGFFWEKTDAAVSN